MSRKVPFSMVRIGRLIDTELSTIRNELVGKEWFPHQLKEFADHGSFFIPLITSLGEDGEKENNSTPPFLPCKHSAGFGGTLEIIKTFGITPLRTRFMKISPSGEVSLHYDRHAWPDKVRMHIPINTHESVIFHCGEDAHHMMAGEIWLIDNDDKHGVKNPSDIERVHLVVDIFIREIGNLGKTTLYDKQINTLGYYKPII